MLILLPVWNNHGYTDMCSYYFNIENKQVRYKMESDQQKLQQERIHKTKKTYVMLM